MLNSAATLSEVVVEDKRTFVVRGQWGDRPALIRRLKAEHPAPAELGRLRYGAEIAKGLGLPGVVQVLALERDARNLAVVLEDFGGVPLRTLLGEGGIEIGDALRIAIQLAQTLGELHRRHIVHKNLEPATVFIDRRTLTVKIAGFDIASRLSSESPTVTAAAAIEGNLAYVSPEQTGRMNRPVDYRTDFYSLGVILYEMLGGRRPFEAADPLTLVHGHIAVTPRPLHEVRANIWRPLSDVVSKLLAKNAEDRYQSAYGVAADLEECRRQLDMTATITDLVPGERDVSARFQLPLKLYGREAQRATLTAAFDRVSRGATELLVVSGYSGIGKSSLVNEILRPVTERHGYYVSGKFDRIGNLPYGALIQALRGLIRQILTESGERILVFRGLLLEALGQSGQVVIDVVPELALIVGPQPAVPPLGPSESQNRFNLVFRALIDAFTREQPLALFLDDLQWADTASLVLIRLLLGDPSRGALLLIGAYRDNEVHDAHPLLLSLAETRKGPAVVTEVSLQPLDLADVERLVADTLDPDRGPGCRDLAALVHQKTGGNPFFVRQFLTSLYERELVTFDPQQGCFRWDLDRVREEPIPDELADFMADKIRELSLGAQRAMRLAACIGTRFDLPTLSRTGARSDDLWEAVEQGLVLPIGDAYKYVPLDDEGPVSGERAVEYMFAHDRVLEAAYALIPKDERQRLHLLIGRLWLGRTPTATRDSRLFDIANQLDLSLDLIDDPAERIELSNLNLAAGRKAKASAAYEPALRYLRAGLDLLPADAVSSSYETWFALSRDRSECLYLGGRFDDAEAAFEEVLRAARSKHDAREIHSLKMALFVSRGNYEGLIKEAILALRLFGLEVPEGEALKKAYEAEVASLNEEIARRTIAGLAEVPEATDPDHRARVLLLNQTIPGAYTRPELFQFVSTALLNRSILHGVAPGSAFGFEAYSIVLAGGLGEYAKAYDLATLGMALSERLDDPPARFNCLFILTVFVAPWRRHTRLGLEPLEQVYAGSLESGSLSFAGLASIQITWQRLMAGDELSWLYERSQKHFQFGKRTGQTDVFSFLAVFQRAILLLVHGAVPEERREDLSEEAVLGRLGHYTAAVNAHHVFSTMVSYLHGDYARAEELGAKAAETIAFNTGNTIAVELCYFRSLAMAALYRDAEPSTQETYKKAIEENAAKLCNWADNCPENFRHKHLLVEAERARIEGRDEEAAALYDRAIEEAAKNEYVQHQAIGNHLAAKLYLARGRRWIARAYMTEARYLFRKWGANSVAAEIAERHADLLPRAEEDAGGGASGATLDLTAAMRASQAISEEIVLEDLLERLMRTLIENAGAQRGLLFLKGDPQLVVEAHEATGRDGEPGRGSPNPSGEGRAVTLRSEPIEARTDVAAAVVRYVERSLERVVLGDAANAGQFRGDPYVKRARPKSVLSTPILKQKKLVGVLYLENNLVTDAFTPERCRMLELLSAQAAISIENARLYATLDQRVKERTHELEISNEELSQAFRRLRETQKQLVTQEKLASLGALTAGIAHELRNPLNFVNNFADLSVTLAGELSEGLAAQRHALPSGPAAEWVETLDLLRQNVTKIGEHSKRADDIIGGMLSHARESTGAREEVDLNAVVAECVHLAYYGMRGKDPEFDVEIRKEYDASLGPVEISTQDMHRVFVNVLGNACYAMRKKKAHGGPYAPVLTIRTRDLGDRAEVIVHDNGTGIDADIVDKIYNPFFTTKPAGEGTGLGLSISHEIVVQGHGGEMRVATEPGRYTEFTISLPKRSAKAAGA